MHFEVDVNQEFGRAKLEEISVWGLSASMAKPPKVQLSDCRGFVQVIYTSNCFFKPGLLAGNPDDYNGDMYSIMLDRYKTEVRGITKNQTDFPKYCLNIELRKCPGREIIFEGLHFQRLNFSHGRAKVTENLDVMRVLVRLDWDDVARSKSAKVHTFMYQSDGDDEDDEDDDVFPRHDFFGGSKKRQQQSYRDNFGGHSTVSRGGSGTKRSHRSRSRSRDVEDMDLTKDGHGGNVILDFNCTPPPIQTAVNIEPETASYQPKKASYEPTSAEKYVTDANVVTEAIPSPSSPSEYDFQTVLEGSWSDDFTPPVSPVKSGGNSALHKVYETFARVAL